MAEVDLTEFKGVGPEVVIPMEKPKAKLKAESDGGKIEKPAVPPPRESPTLDTKTGPESGSLAAEDEAQQTRQPAAETVDALGEFHGAGPEDSVVVSSEIETGVDEVSLSIEATFEVSVNSDL